MYRMAWRALGLAVPGRSSQKSRYRRHRMSRQVFWQEGWLAAVIRARLPRLPDGWVPLHFLIKRSQNLLRAPRRLLHPKGILLLVAGFGFDLIVYVLAQIRMARGTGAGHW